MSTSESLSHLQGNIRLHPVAENKKLNYVFSHLPSNKEAVSCTVRVYVIRAIGLAPTDYNGLVSKYQE